MNEMTRYKWGLKVLEGHYTSTPDLLLVHSELGVMLLGYTQLTILFSI